ncbi:MAG: hypothetical protein KatS3mg112_0632 [Thermogutta sp.]|nr:MAG: hypothetical protein KatS3mg112_0632 [Thermogutta sp.]
MGVLEITREVNEKKAGERFLSRTSQHLIPPVSKIEADW